MSLSVRTTRPSAPARGRRSWPPCAIPRSTSADSPGTPTSLPPSASTAGHRGQPSKRSPQHDQHVSQQVTAILDYAMPLGGRHSETRTFSTMTRSLQLMRDWLLECGVSIAAMESTSTYWKGAFYCLEEVM